MAFFNVDEIRIAVERIRKDHEKRRHRIRSIRTVYCGNCGKDQEHVYLFVRDVPSEFVGTRICTICGFAPGQNPGVKDKKLRNVVLEADLHECVYCGTTEQLVIDHIIPHCRGGEATFTNLLTACRSCNSRRRTGRTPVLRFGRFRK